MISVTPTAAVQIKQAAQQGHMEGLPLRLAAKKASDGSINYAMGFADEEHEDDLHFTSEGIEIVVSPVSLHLLNNTVLDYVTLDNGQHDFIFKNPNDPLFQPGNS